MATVWIAEYNYYDDHWIVGVFATQEAAERKVRTLDAYDARRTDIEEHEVQG